jgi:hypothetical protein
MVEEWVKSRICPQSEDEGETRNKEERRKEKSRAGKQG